MIDTRRNFRSIEVLEDGAKVRVQPGATVRAVNTRLARFGRKLGPDPASEIACTIGGVIANNSSGMACGITANTYRTLESATVVLSNGVRINTAVSDFEEKLAALAPEIYQTLIAIRDEIAARPDLTEKIKSQYLIKNTMGYGLNSFIDFQSLPDIFLHILIGSEGTLGFVSEAVFNTVPLFSSAATTLLIFERLTAATGALERLIATNPTTIELMDSASLKAGKVNIGDITLRDHAALLVEYQASDDESLMRIMSEVSPIHSMLGTVNETPLTTNEEKRAELWHIRKGLYASVAGARKSGTTALLEDISVPVFELASTCMALQSLFEKYDYEDAVIFGHAKDGNIHFLINEDFRDALKTERYRAFTEEMVSLVLAKGGSLKAEHGTGRMMAPFVERQFGPELYEIMKKIKRAFDPNGILNPGVLISEDPLAHLHNIKFHPTIEAVADNCVECGYCEPICPSKNLTTTPRQRIVLQRAIAASNLAKNEALRKALAAQSIYGVEETCAVDGLCESSCPVGINTGELVTTLRSNRNSDLSNTIVEQAAQHWGTSMKVIEALQSLARSIPATVLTPINNALRDLLGTERVPLWSRNLPRAGRERMAKSEADPEFVLFSSCVDSLFESETNRSLQSLAKKAGIGFRIPMNIANLCCGTPFKSKGFKDAYEIAIQSTIDSLIEASENGRLPIVCENSSCSQGILEAIKSKSGSGLIIIDAVDYAAKYMLPKISLTQKLNAVALHPTCSSTQLGSNKNLELLAGAIAEQVTIPEDWGCCAFAGDRGLLHPELTASATRAEVASLRSQEFDAYLSTNLTCEIGLSTASGKSYEHILCKVDQLSTAR
jgi:D-lactate dehydrogenase